MPKKNRRFKGINTVSNSKNKKQPHHPTAPSTSQRTTTRAKNITTKKRISTRLTRSSYKNGLVVNDMPESTTRQNVYAKPKIKKSDIKYTTNYEPSTLFVPSVFPRTISYPFHNNYQMSLDIQKEINNKHANLSSIQPKLPSGFNDYLMNKRTYHLAGNGYGQASNAQSSPPTNLHEQLKMLFIEQEKERQKLRIQHLVQKEKFTLSVEQEVLRIHGQMAHALVNQLLPLSVCTVLKDRDVYSSPYKNIIDKNEQPHYDDQHFLSCHQELDDKWKKNKNSMLIRQRNEAQSLHAVQKMDWEWKLKELFQSLTSESNINEDHVPIVLVEDNF